LGYLSAARRTIDRLRLYQEPWSVNTPAQKVLSACFDDAGFKRKTKSWLEREREFLLRGLSRVRGLRPCESQANFLLVRLARGSAARLRALLLKRKILIRVCDSFVGLGADYFRLAIRSREENRRLLDALEEILGGAVGA
jgi:threonine-phosphate decarboxylase